MTEGSSEAPTARSYFCSWWQVLDGDVDSDDYDDDGNGGDVDSHDDGDEWQWW